MDEKEHGFKDIIKKLISEVILSPIIEGAEVVMKNIDEKIINIEKRIIRNIEKRIIRTLSTMLIMGLGIIFLIFSFFFALKEYLGLTNSLSFFFIGIIILLIGILLKLGKSNR